MMFKKLALTILVTASSTIAVDALPITVLDIQHTISDPNLIYPESVETDVDKMMNNWYLRNYALLDSMTDYRKTVNATDAEIIDRLSKIPAEVELPYNSIVRNVIDMYTNRRRSLVENMLGMSHYYMPIFEQALEKENVPHELKYLPIIESALNPDAVSRAGATGLWQFMVPTAKGLGLEVNTIVDERRDPIRSSEMAAKYLKQLYSIYNDWSLAIAAYNCGPGNVNKALRRAGGGNKNFWEIYPFLPAETRSYVPAFIAAV
ncbi:MAG: transglycosylase SLT domain-containing protein, partial [Muribaculaceae bacterium]|nr:transglycosylase SLT domain-containing protein [Muribaculaceae bacterium]